MNQTKRSYYFFQRPLGHLLTILMILQLAACGTVAPPQSIPAPPTIPDARVLTTPTEEEAEVVVEMQPEELQRREQPAQGLINSGRYLDAALLLTELAASLPTPQKQDYQLRVSSLLLLGNYILQAEQVLKETDVRPLGLEMRLRKDLLDAQLALAKQQPNVALKKLRQLTDEIRTAAPPQQKEFYQIQIDIYSAIGDFANAAHARSIVEVLLDDPMEALENQEILLRDLQKLTARELSALAAQTKDPIFTGWLELAKVAKTAADLQQAEQGITDWQSRYPQHPVQNSIINAIMAKQPEALGRPTRIAVMLPMSGRYEKAATAIRNGFLTAYFAEQKGQPRPEIRFYDEGDDPDNITDIYQKAVDEGADFVVGPLNKQAVTNLTRYNHLQGGVLSLNYGDIEEIGNPPFNFFQMSLSPEQEAIHVAEHAWLDGHMQAAAIYPDSDWGTRIFNAFKSRWEELGGVIVEHQTYDMKKSDYAAPIKQLLNIDESENRHQNIRRFIGEKFFYEPRRRDDVDFIFMAAYSRQGRLLRPQLKFHRAANIPVYSTSHVYSGSLKANMDRDMNGVRFSDMPWTLTHDKNNELLKEQIKTVWPNTSNRYMRLFALGIDAYRIIPELNRLRRNRFTSIQGTTGILYLDVSNRIQRRLLWAQFRKGEPKVLAEY
ncbi:MAG: penicillin-binding protein activator [Gammaproteobacteria bacterium]|nr:penicillin-binding protein activator [Gammaproteobacteria bacterium]MDH5800060.1 penicillin-binding protein activator [Gammaproteobacteria bacterium]